MDSLSPKVNSLSYHTNTKMDITTIFEKYKKTHNKLSPLPLNQFYPMAINENCDLLQMQPDSDVQNFVSFRELNQGAVSELKRSLQQSKMVWNNYSKYLFGEPSLDEIEMDSVDQQQFYTSRKLQLIHNRETFHKMRKQYKQQEEDQINQVKQALKKIHTQTNGIKVYPSLAYQDQQKLELLRKQVRLGGVQQLQERNSDAQQLQKRILESQVALNQIKKQFAYAYNYDYNFWGPCSRDGSSMVTFDRKLYLYGGSSSVQQEDLCVAIVDKQFYKWSPQKLDEKSIHGYRVHHTAGIYKNFMILFGGEIHIEQSNHKLISECTSDIKTISLTSFDIKLIKQPGTIPPRKCHIGEIIGRSLLIFGGIDNRGNYMKDLLCYDISQSKWVSLNVDPFDLYANGIAFHKSCLVTQNKFCDIYRQDPDLKFSNQGIYVFGGQDKFGNYLDTFIRIDVYQKPIRIEQVDYKGSGPIARCQHSMNYNEVLSAIVVYGGKNDDNTIEGFLNDLFLFDVKNSSWIQLELKGAQMPGRCGHSSSCIDTKIFIFGGYNYNGFVKSDVLVIELDSNISHQLIQSDKINEDKPRNSKIRVSFHQLPEKRKTIDKTNERKKEIEKLNFKNSHSFLPMPRRVTMLINAMRFGQEPKSNTEGSGSNSNKNSPKDGTRRPHRNMTMIIEGKQEK
ncbi:unnamed protein product [Paramecium pentaurelia]|uniref:Kelch motif family protein n=1 Tax=Paramecium pentaurelia TaxID=43138 RepID=A0A8S1WVW3_9CILI|nr:unnamed protein product [Paramecium pentaurelia]